jgi:hypothetical protein
LPGSKSAPVDPAAKQEARKMAKRVQSIPEI